jgi:adenine deaminase
MRHCQISFFIAILISSVIFAPLSFAKEYDLVILNGRVMDPQTNLDAVRNVGIKNGKIAKITEHKIEGKETIDATGLVVACAHH